MDRVRQKGKKEKHVKHHDKSKNHSLVADAKSITENLKIKEILRTVKINSSMRLKAPRGSKVMDFAEVEQFAQDKNQNDGPEPNSNSDHNQPTDDVDTISSSAPSDESENQAKDFDPDIQQSIGVIDDVISCLSAKTSNCEDKSTAETEISKNETGNQSLVCGDTLSMLPNINSLERSNRVRKLSLDQTMLSRRGSLSQSEVDLHVVGKSPLERKSSFFRKKMNSFLRNTSEIFKRQSLAKSDALPRRSSMSFSLQSLHDGGGGGGAHKESPLSHSQELHGSFSSLSSAQLDSGSFGSQESTPGGISCSQPLLTSTHPDNLSESVNGLDEAYLMEQILGARAISMSSGLDSEGTNKRKQRSKRVTWLASEGLTNYLRRVIHDERPGLSSSRSFQDSRPDAPKDSKGRRLSYQRAVSGEDPVAYTDSSLRSRHIPEHSEANYDLASLLHEFSTWGVPPLVGFQLVNLSEETQAFLPLWEYREDINTLFDWAVFVPELPAYEEARQSVIREMIATEADYINHLIAIVEVFIAAAHALQDRGKLLFLETERLFTNLPDVLNASLQLWDATFHPMLADAYRKRIPFNTELMYDGFYNFRHLLRPYEKYVMEQKRAMDYLRSLNSNPEFMMFLGWCHTRRAFNRLQLPDIMAKPMQRLTKYALLLRRIIVNTEMEPEKTSLLVMEMYVKNYVLDLNRTVRQKEELEMLDFLSETIDVYEMDFRDEEMDRLFRAYSSVNLKHPMIDCSPCYSRTLILEGDVRFKDNLKEMEVRAVLMTDMLLICKKINVKGSPYTLKLIRPKYMIQRMLHFSHMHKTKKEVASIVFLMVDEVGSSCHSFTFTEPSKDCGPNYLKSWELKLREARMSYDIGVWYSRNPSRDHSEAEVDTSEEYTPRYPPGMKPSSEDANIEREARERVAVMMHRGMGTECECTPSLAADSFDVQGDATGSTRSGHLRNPMFRTSTGSSRGSRLSSFQKSTSATSHDEPGPSSRYPYLAGSSVEHLIPPINPNDDVTSITVNVVSESETDTVVPTTQNQVSPVRSPSRGPLLKHSHSHGHSRGNSPGPSHGHSHGHSPVHWHCPALRRQRDTLKVRPQRGVLALVHSLPDLTFDPTLKPIAKPARSPSPQTASERLFQSHQELLNRNRLAAENPHSSHLLSPHRRGISYPPPSPSRGELRRSLAFSYSFKNPPLRKVGHVDSQSQHQVDTGPSTGTSRSASKSDEERGAVNPSPVPSTSQAKDQDAEKKQDKKLKKEDKKSLNKEKDDLKRSSSSANEGGGLLAQARFRSGENANSKDKE